MRILASIIIPCYNSEAYIRQAVESALGQTYPNKEVIVVNDGSTDRSLEILQEYQDRIKVVSQQNRGLPAARNAGIRASSGDFLAFLDSDDYWDDGFLEKSIDALESSGAGISYSGWQNIGLEGPRGRPYVPPDLEKLEDKLERILTNAQWPVHAAVVRREVVESAGGFIEHWRSCEDFAFWLRTATRFPLILVPEVLAFYRHHPTQMTKDQSLVALSVWGVQQEFFKEQPASIANFDNGKLRKLSDGELLKRGFECYWKRDLKAARKIFRKVMALGYGNLNDWKYMLPSLLPENLHRALIDGFEKPGNKKQA
jgi:glycosyltransferase involved in cell wall biosynthesis